MNVLVFAVNWHNRGDESAIRAMYDELKDSKCDLDFKFIMNQYNVQKLPMDNNGIIEPFIVCDKKKSYYDRIAQRLLINTFGKINILRGGYRRRFNEIIKAIKWADCAIYAPGGPCIGDIYRHYHLLLFMRIMQNCNVPYFIYAPSMGPFKSMKKQIKECLDASAVICLRESISKGFLEELGIKKPINVTLDSAIQHDIDMHIYEKLFNQDDELFSFINSTKKVIGITITDLKWNRKYIDTNVDKKINKTFHQVIKHIINKGYKVIFIPQLFGQDNDYNYMKSFADENCYVLPDTYDCYFQQYLISKIYAVIGMRYHSNVFSAKMGTPFISISYEQKTKGFMEQCGLSDYCIDVMEISSEMLIDRLGTLEENYSGYRDKLKEIHGSLKQRSYRTTDLLLEWIKEINK